MIGRLRGTLLEKQPPYLLIDVGGVGYEVQAPMTTFYRLPERGEEVILHTHLAVSETSHQLFAFAQERDRRLFRTLIKVSGVGPKMAIAILSGMEADDVARCVREDKVNALTKVPGVGKKTAERLVIELRDRLKGWEMPREDLAGDLLPEPDPAREDHQEEAESALVALGYKPTEATRMIAAAARQTPSAGSQELIRLALRALSQV